MIHELKTWPVYFNEIVRGDKAFEVRKDDRGFRVGDDLLLKEYIPEGDEDIAEGYTGRILHRRVSTIFRDSTMGINQGYVVMGLKKF